MSFSDVQKLHFSGSNPCQRKELTIVLQVKEGGEPQVYYIKHSHFYNELTGKKIFSKPMGFFGPNRFCSTFGTSLHVGLQVKREKKQTNVTFERLVFSSVKPKGAHIHKYQSTPIFVLENFSLASSLSVSHYWHCGSPSWLLQALPSV